MANLQQLLLKYNRPVPRYTSYPTVPHWGDFVGTQHWQQCVGEKYQENKQAGISLYIHLPFCESLCTYCGCNKKITANHLVEEEYITAVLTEWHLYRSILGEKPLIREIHLGGGTPTFFSPTNLERLLNGIFKTSTIHPQKQFSFEGHPNNTTLQHLQTLCSLGFTRVSYGVQDNDPVVQRAINRLQPFYNVQKATENARATGYESVNFDLIYGLPFQTLRGLENTFNKVVGLMPDRIAFYSYAHVPWKQKAQRLFDESNLPPAALKLQLYLQGKQMLALAGYVDIGMDHFALPHDELHAAWQNKTLHRNFMGYTTTHTNYLIGLGVSAISDTGNAYAQNAKELENYYRLVLQGQLATNKGYFLTRDDEAIKKYIIAIACQNEVLLQQQHMQLLNTFTTPELENLQADGLVVLKDNLVKVTKQGRQFIRNICHAFDQHGHLAVNEGAGMFSKAI